MASDTHKLIRDGKISGVSITRLYPGSRDVGLDEMNEKQAKHRKVGHEHGAGARLSELFFALDEGGTKQTVHTTQKRKHAARQYGIVQQVICAADEGRLSLKKRNADGNVCQEDYWKMLRECIQRYRTGALETSDIDKVESYRKAYNACKGQVVGLSRFIITTTGNVRCTEMLEHWYSSQATYGVPRRGVMVFVDEAAKDWEINVWSGIVCEQWADDVKGVFLFGDVK